MSIIEQAARRLEELKRSGIEIPESGTPARTAVESALTEGVPVRVARMLEQQGKQQPAAETARGQNRPALRDVSPAPSTKPSKESRHVDIDMSRLAAMGYLSPETPRAQIADEFRDRKSVV